MADTDDKDQKTELPTQRKLEKAREQGDVAKSQEVTSLFILGAATLAFMIGASGISADLAGKLRGMLANTHQVSMDGAGLMHLARYSVLAILAAVALPFLFGMTASVAGNMIQHLPVWSAQAMAPKLSRLSLLQGLKRMLGKEALVNFLKGLVKIVVVGAAICLVIWPYRGILESMPSADIASTLPRIASMTVKLMGGVLAIFFLLAGLDYLYQRHSWMERQMMTRQEIKEEYKETEGSPEIKQKLAQIRRQMAQRRMMSAVPKASVVIMNPTHYAVALQYEMGMEAPVCVAKGLDELALRIKSVAMENDVPVVENPPLARALHAAVDIDETIPEDQYKAVAEVIGYVMGLRRQRR
ncbi:MAG: flagellar biosynthesis protein FlhB [Methylocystis sp.]|nr:flagellar biosynthesis protein FlhB [Methylocystis sp.]MCA3583415.1 flagellar biosynthesis protein FlhB [Methylocystis sp.]MCA3589116.1 flagellar biosynthesis protein FlhB [Methylocystis sp.]MCA3591934.1 flagellar biosynthesis protein FlhB [Methylocystis sp.]